MMTTTREAPKLESVAQTAVVLRDGKLTRDQIELLKKTVAKGASDDEFALFIELCNHTGLNPFAKQIYCLQRRTKNEEGQWVNAMVTQTGIDGFRLIAERTEKYRGQTAPVFFDAAGNEHKIWLDNRKPPHACKVGVLKTGFDEPMWGIVLYEEFVQKTKDGSPNVMWRTKPTVMLAKCAEAIALRRAFPQELSGIYAEDEMPPEHVEEREALQIPASATRPRQVDAEDRAVSATADGDVLLGFGRFKGQKLTEVPTSALIEMFRDPWKDESRKANATERLGIGFVKAVEALLVQRDVSPALSLYIAQLQERVARGEVLDGNDAEELRQWAMDHPTAPETPSDG